MTYSPGTVSEPTTKQWASIQMVPWRELCAFIEGLYPRGGASNAPPDPNKTLAAMTDHELMAEVADHLFTIRNRRESKVAPLRQQLVKIEADYRDELRKLREEILSRRPSH